MYFLEKWYLQKFGLKRVLGDLRLPGGVEKAFLEAPFDILPGFVGIRKLRRGRGKDHPRYGRFLYALAKQVRPAEIVEVGTFAGGTAIGWAAALNENRTGFLTCIDNDSYSAGVYPKLAQANILSTGLAPDRFKLVCGDSREKITQVAREKKGIVDLYLVDADHTYEGALADIVNGLPMVKKDGLMLVHDVEVGRPMAEETKEHPSPVYEAFMKIASENKYSWCILQYIRKHLAILKVP